VTSALQGSHNTNEPVSSLGELLHALILGIGLCDGLVKIFLVLVELLLGGVELLGLAEEQEQACAMRSCNQPVNKAFACV